MGTNGRRQENNGNMSRGTPKIVGSVPNWDFGKREERIPRNRSHCEFQQVTWLNVHRGEMTGVRHCAQILNGHLFG